MFVAFLVGKPVSTFPGNALGGSSFQAHVTNQQTRTDHVEILLQRRPESDQVALFLEEAGLPYEAIPVDTRKATTQAGLSGDQSEREGPGDRRCDAVVFDSNAILLYLAEKTGKFLPASTRRARGELLSWLMFVCVRRRTLCRPVGSLPHYAPEKNEYAINRYAFEAQRHFGIIDARLARQRYMLGGTYTIVDMDVWGWARLVPTCSATRVGQVQEPQGLTDRVNARPRRSQALRMSRHLRFLNLSTRRRRARWGRDGPSPRRPCRR